MQQYDHQAYTGYRVAFAANVSFTVLAAPVTVVALSGSLSSSSRHDIAWEQWQSIRNDKLLQGVVRRRAGLERNNIL